jgi:hypothetical protein
MRIETMTVKLLRSAGEGRFANDTTELRVSLDEDDDWEAIELELRKRASANIARYWSELLQAEEDERQRSLQKRRDLRDEYLASLPEGAENQCDECPEENGYQMCDGCEFNGPGPY